MQIFSRLLKGQILSACLVLLPAWAQTNVTTYHNDIGRTGQNLQETILTPANVNPATFGLLYETGVDGQVLAQPLYLSNVTIGGAPHNVLYVVTENDSLYAFDADLGTQLWKVSMLDAAHGAATGATTVPPITGCNPGGPGYGITGTPVIDPATNTIYLVSASQEVTKTQPSGYPVQRLHALDVTTGAEKFGGPKTISATVSGTGVASSAGSLTFDPAWHLQRPGLLLLNGTVYIGWGSFCDLGPWHGWIMGYHATTLQQTAVIATTPNGSGGALWMSGAGLAADLDGTNGAGRLFVATGNGGFSATVPYTTNMDYGDSILNLTEGLQVADDFTPYNQALLSFQDSDVGGGGVLVLPNQAGPNPHLLINLGKGQGGNDTLTGGVIFVANRDNLGGYHATGDSVVQRLTVSLGERGIPSYWNGNVYFWTGQGAPMWQYSLTDGKLSSSPIAVTTEKSPTASQHMANPVISANGNTNGIVWSVDSSSANLGGPTYPTYLLAHSATNVGTALYSSGTNAARDMIANSSVSFQTPTIANGKVFVGTYASFAAFGLLNTFTLQAAPANLSVAPGTSRTSSVTIIPSKFSGSVAFSASGLPAGVTASFSPTSSTTGTTLTFTAAANAASTSKVITITGTSGTLTQTTTINLSVVATPSFSLTVAPTNTSLVQGTSETAGITVVPSGNFSGTVAFTASGLPSGVTESFNPMSSASGTTLTISASASAALGTSLVKITGTSGSLTQVTSLSLTVTAPPSFSLMATPSSVSVETGANAVSTVTVTPINGFTGTVAFSLSGLPSGVTASFEPTSSASSTKLTLTAASAASAGASTLIVTGISGGLTEKTSLRLTVTAGPNFTIAAAPSSVNVVAGSSATSTVTVSPLNGFTGTVVFTASGLPSGVTASFNPTSSTSSTTLTLAAASTAVAGSTTIAITGTSGSLTRTVNVTAIVTAAPNFSVTAAPAGLNVMQGATGTSTISVIPANGFTGAVSFSASGLPSGVTASFSPTSSTTSTLLTLSVGGTTSTGASVVTITGTSGGLMHSTPLSLTVVGGTPTPIVPYIQVNNGAWQETASVTVRVHSSVNLGPQPLGGIWAWTGPNGYASNSRQIDDIPLSLGVNTYVATYTNADGVQSTETFTITVVHRRHHWW